MIEKLIGNMKLKGMSRVLSSKIKEYSGYDCEVKIKEMEVSEYDKETEVDLVIKVKMNTKQLNKALEELSKL